MLVGGVWDSVDCDERREQGWKRNRPVLVQQYWMYHVWIVYFVFEAFSVYLFLLSCLCLCGRGGEWGVYLRARRGAVVRGACLNSVGGPWCLSIVCMSIVCVWAVRGIVVVPWSCGEPVVGVECVLSLLCSCLLIVTQI